MFTIGGAATVNGVAGNIMANAGSVYGVGGSITIEQSSLNATGGILLSPGQTLLINGTGGGAAGFVGVTAKGSLPLQFAGSVVLNADGSGVAGAGGSISVSAGRFVFGGSNVMLSAKGGTGGNGGTISVLSTGPSGSASDLVIGGGANQFSIDASGGSAGSTRGNGGAVLLSVASSTNSLNVLSNLALSPLGLVGDGGRLTAKGAGNVLFSNGITMNGGTLAGKGGSVAITGDATTSALTVGGLTSNGVNGAITANGGALSGKGGEIELNTSSANGIALSGASPVLSVLPGGKHNSVGQSDNARTEAWKHNRRHLGVRECAQWCRQRGCEHC